MRVISWNVNGIRSVLGKGFLDWLMDTQADLVCLQETKIHERDLDEHVPVFPGYSSYWNPAERSGYSGVAVLTKHEPLSVQRGLGTSPLDNEGRVLTLEFEELFIVNVYVPNSQTGYARLPIRLAWDTELRSHLATLQSKKPIIVCGDFNVAHTELDIGIPDATNFPGCSPEERQSFEKLLQLGFVDTLRHFHPQDRHYSWWAYANEARGWNQGIRFDYHLVSDVLKPLIQKAATHREILGSDHGPVSLELDYSLGTTKAATTSVSPSGQYGFGI